MCHRNHEHYPDPTAGQAMKNIEDRERAEAAERIKPLIHIMHELAALAGFEIAERVVFRDIDTRREYR